MIKRCTDILTIFEDSTLGQIKIELARQNLRLALYHECSPIVFLTNYSAKGPAWLVESISNNGLPIRDDTQIMRAGSIVFVRTI